MTGLGVSTVLAECRAQGRAALIGYLPVGFPDPATSLRAMVSLVENGCDIVEVGLPYSDPLIDGPANQRAAAAALAAGTKVTDVFAATRAVRSAGAPPLVMTYWNLVLKYGVDRFADDLAAAGGAGLVTPDLIPEEALDWIAASERTGLDRVFLIAPQYRSARTSDRNELWLWCLPWKRTSDSLGMYEGNERCRPRPKCRRLPRGAPHGHGLLRAGWPPLEKGSRPPR